MIKYAKIINETIGLVDVGLNSNKAYYQSIGMIEMEVEQSDVDGLWYLSEKCPHKSEEEKQKEERERINNLSLPRNKFLNSIYDKTQTTPEQIEDMISSMEDITIYFKYSNEFKRGDSLICALCNLLKISSDDMDKIFIGE